MNVYDIRGIFRKNGKKVFLGRTVTTQREINNLLENITNSSTEDGTRWINIGSNVYDLNSFAGVQITKIREALESDLQTYN